MLNFIKRHVRKPPGGWLRAQIFDLVGAWLSRFGILILLSPAGGAVLGLLASARYSPATATLFGILCAILSAFLVILIRRVVGSLPMQRIRIVIGAGPPFDIYTERTNGKTHHLRIRVENASWIAVLPDCELKLVDITGPLSSKCPVTIAAGFTLNPRGSRYIPIASFDETSTSDLVGEAPELHFPINQLSRGRSYLDDRNPHRLKFAVTTATSRPHSETCNLWIDEDGKMRLQKTESNAAI